MGTHKMWRYNIGRVQYEDLSPSKRTIWFCSVCENLNLLTSLDLSDDSIPTDNSFSVLSDSEKENTFAP